MKKIILDIREYTKPDQIHEYIAQKMDFPQYYGKNLDALYDMLTDIREETCIALLLGEESGKDAFIRGLIRVFNEAEYEKNNLAVLICNLGKDGFLS